MDLYKIDEKGTLKSTEHDEYENIAGSVWVNLFMGSIGNAYYCPRRLVPFRSTEYGPPDKRIGLR
jgi:hypothetical protein